MSASNPGPARRFFRGAWRVVDVSRRVVLNLLFLLIVIAVLVALARSGPASIADKTALVLRIDGTVGEQKSGTLRSTALDQVRGEAVQKVQLRDILAALDAAASDPKITSLVVVLDEMRPTGFSTVREIAAAIDRFKKSGKKVVAWGSGYDQRQYYIAAHADEIYLHPLGMVYIAGFGSLKNYYKDALDKLGVTVNVVRVGTFKSAVEPFIANAPSAPALEADKVLYEGLWKTYVEAVEQARKLPAGAIMRGIDEAPQRLAAAGGDAAKFALAEKLVDGLKTRDELRALLIERGAKDEQDNTFRQVGYDDYLGHVKPRLTGDAVGVVVAEGEIVDGQAPAGTIGGLSTANLIRKARDDKSVKAIVLRVDSPGGSVFGSELVRRELEVTRAAGKPVVVSMGNVAASGGYWISTASDEIVADAATITGSIGVFALLPTFDQTLAKVGVHSAGVGTTWLRNADDPRLPLDPRLADLVQKSVDHTYLDFTTKVATARKTTPEKIDAVAQGRVWTGLQAKERGLVDTIGQFDVAIHSAATRPSSATRRASSTSSASRASSPSSSRCSTDRSRACSARSSTPASAAPSASRRRWCTAPRAISAGSPTSPSGASPSPPSSTASAANRTERHCRRRRRPSIPAQLEAVHHLGGPCLVLAGAGSGKTRVIVHKIARLLEAGYAPAQIAAITFTNKAAAEMRERARSLVGGRAAAKLAISTFHSLGVRILREDGARLGLPANFSILDSDDVLGVLKDAGGTTDNALARRWQWAIGGWKNRGLDAATAEAEVLAGEHAGSSAADAVVAVRVMQRYQERLAAYRAVDFDDLIVLPTRLLRDDAAVRDAWRDRLRYILVDEYQDTNGVQYELMKLIAGPRGLFTAVGDDDQSIYGWRGATVENLKRLPADYPTLRVIPLEQNYRSTGNILAAANAVIGHNAKLFEKKLWSDLGAGEAVVIVECDDEVHEAERAVARVESLRGAGAACADIAILYRANHQARVFEQALRKAGIPYKVSGGQSFFDRAEIRDLCAWLRLIVNLDDDPAFLRATTSPKRGIGHQTLAALGAFAGRWRSSLFEALFAETLADALPRRAIAGLHEFGRTVNALQERAKATSGSEPAKTLLLEWLQEIGYEEHLHEGAESPPLAAARWANVLDFVDWIARRCGGTGAAATGDEEPAQSVLDVAQTISVIISLAERGDEQNVVTLSTLHAAKGLEWPHVLLASVNEGLLPFAGDDEEASAGRIEEERRLMYVGITRARATLAVSTLRRRKRGRTAQAALPSRFVAEMKLDEAKRVEDPRAKLMALRAAAAARASAARP